MNFEQTRSIKKSGPNSEGNHPIVVEKAVSLSSSIQAVSLPSSHEPTNNDLKDPIDHRHQRTREYYAEKASCGVGTRNCENTGAGTSNDENSSLKQSENCIAVPTKNHFISTSDTLPRSNCSVVLGKDVEQNRMQNNAGSHSKDTLNVKTALMKEGEPPSKIEEDCSKIGGKRKRIPIDSSHLLMTISDFPQLFEVYLDSTASQETDNSNNSKLSRLDFLQCLIVCPKH